MTIPMQEPGAGARVERVPGPGVRADGRLAPGAFARGVLATRDRLVDLTRRRPLLADGALAAVLFALSMPPVTGFAGRSRLLSVALPLAVVAPLVWRRRTPALVLVIIVVLAVAQRVAHQPITDYLALLVAFYTVAVLSPRWQTLACAAVLEAGGVVALEKRHGVDVLALLPATALIAAAGLLGYYVRTTRRAHLAAQAERADRLEREREHQASLAVSAERARIAREMHDIVAHNIAVMIALAEGAAYTTKADPDQAATLMGQISATGRTALTEMRRLLAVLRQPVTPGNAPQPTLAELDALLATFSAAGLQADLVVSGRAFPLPPSAQLALYRMVQESLTNTLKHAPGASAQVRLTYRPGEVELDVTDGGRPFKPPSRALSSGAVPSGHGIAGMRERAAVFGGQMSAGPRPGGGWGVHAVLRLDPALCQPDPSATETEGL